ncbi:MAG: 60S ribosomal export protein NMD3 [Halobacteriota archaeon]
MRCALCGRESEDTLCPECYVERNEIIHVDKVSLLQCPKCGYFKISGKWKKMDFMDALEEVLKEQTHTHPDLQVDEVSVISGGQLLHVKGHFRGLPVERYKEINLDVNKEVCQRCSRKAGGYFESILQVRTEGRKLHPHELEEVAKVVREEIEADEENPKSFVSKVVERKEGIDYYLGSREIGRKISKKIAHELGGKIKESKKTSGRFDGKELYRFTFLVRLPSFNEGDVVEDANNVALVTNKKLWKAISSNGESINLKEPNVIAKDEDLYKTILLNSDESVAEVLHPVTKEVVMAEDHWGSKTGDPVLLLEYRDKYYIFPQELLD